MTVISPHPRPRALRRAIGARARTLGALTLALVIAVVPLAAGPATAARTGPAANAPTSADTATPSPTPTPSPDDGLSGQTVFTLSPVANGIVRPGDGLAVSVTLQNGTDTAIAPVAITLALGASALQDRPALSAWLNGESTNTAVTPVGSTTLETVASGSEQTQGIVVAPEDPALAGRAPGVYPLIATYDSAGGLVTSTSAMIVPAEGSAAVGIGVVVPITADATSGGLLTAPELAQLTSPDGSLTGQLDAVEGTASILAVDPALPAAIRVLGTSAPVSATEWLTRLLALQNSRFALQFGDADVVAQLQAGLTRPMQPLSLQVYMNPGDFLPGPNATSVPTPTPTPTSTPDPDVDPAAPVYPSLAELTDIGGARSGVYWPGTGTATPAVVARLGEQVANGRGSLTLVPSTTTQSGATGATVPAHAVTEDADLLVYDAAASRELHNASLIEQNGLRGAPLTAATAYLAFASAESGGEPIAVTLDRAGDRSRVSMRTAITAASQAPGVTPLTLGGIATRQPVTVAIADAPADEARVSAASALIADETELSRFATILDDVTLITGPERAELLQLLGLEWLLDPVAWQSAVDLHRAATTSTLDSVGILPPSPINLFSAGAPIPIWLRNDLPYPVNLVLFATPDDLRLDVAEATEAVAGPQSNTRVPVPVQARVGNGDVSVQLQLRSRTLEPIGAPQVVDVSVRADWEGVGIAILSVLGGGFLVLGVVRTVLRLRARRAGRAAGPLTEDPASTPAAGKDAE